MNSYTRIKRGATIPDSWNNGAAKIDPSDAAYERYDL